MILSHFLYFIFFLYLQLGPYTLFYLQPNFSYFYNGISSSHIMPFISFFEKLLIDPFILYKFRVFEIFSLNKLSLRKIQIIPTKYPKHVIKLLGLILGYYSSYLN